MTQSMTRDVVTGQSGPMVMVPAHHHTHICHNQTTQLSYATAHSSKLSTESSSFLFITKGKGVCLQKITSKLSSPENRHRERLIGGSSTKKKEEGKGRYIF